MSNTESLTSQLGMDNGEESIEVSKKDLERSVKDGECIQRMLKSPDFKRIIQEAYLEENVVRNVLNKTNPAMQRPEIQVGIEQQLIAASALNSWLSQKIQMANTAKMMLDEDRMREADEPN